MPTAGRKGGGCLPSAQAPHADLVEPGRGRLCGSGMAARSLGSKSQVRSSRPMRRGTVDGRTHRAPSADVGVRRAFAQAFPQSPKVDAVNLAQAIATLSAPSYGDDALRPLHRGRAECAQQAGSRGLSSVRRQGRLPNATAALHSPTMPSTTSGAGRRLRPRRGSAAGGRARFQDARCARSVARRRTCMTAR